MSGIESELAESPPGRCYGCGPLCGSDAESDTLQRGPDAAGMSDALSCVIQHGGLDAAGSQTLSQVHCTEAWMPRESNVESGCGRDWHQF